MPCKVLRIDLGEVDDAGVAIANLCNVQDGAGYELVSTFIAGKDGTDLVLIFRKK